MGVVDSLISGRLLSAIPSPEFSVIFAGGGGETHRDRAEGRFRVCWGEKPMLRGGAIESTQLR